MKKHAASILTAGFLLCFTYIGVASWSWGIRNPKANDWTLATHFLDVIAFRRVSDFQEKPAILSEISEVEGLFHVKNAEAEATFGPDDVEAIQTIGNGNDGFLIIRLRITDRKNPRIIQVHMPGSSSTDRNQMARHLLGDRPIQGD